MRTPAARLVTLAALLVWGRMLPPASTPPGPVALDGDTVLLADGREVRLLGVDTPERGSAFAAEATAFTNRFLEQEGVGLDPQDPRRDRYDRLLADLVGPQGSLSASLVDEGLAWIYRGPVASLLDRQALAVEHRRGLHLGLDGWDGGPLLVTGQTFHGLACSLLGARRRQLPLEASPAVLFKAGKAPCRRCLPWPPQGWPAEPPAPR